MFAQRRHYLHRLLYYEDELAALIAWVLDRQSLSSGWGLHTLPLLFFIPLLAFLVMNHPLSLMRLEDISFTSSSGSASFSDGLYGLRRAPYAQDESGKQESLSSGQQRLALLQLVGAYCLLGYYMTRALMA